MTISIAQSRKDLINGLTPIAKNIAHEMSILLGGDFSGDNDIERVDIEPDGKMLFVFNKFSHIRFSNIRVKGEFNITHHDPVLLDEKIIELNSVKISNRSSSPLMRSYEYNESVSTSTEIDVGAAFELSLTQKLTYGLALIGGGGETEIAAKLSTSFNHKTGAGTSTDRTISNSIEVMPMIEICLTTKRSVSKFMQKMEVSGELDWGIEVWSHGDYHYKFDSIEHMETILAGYGETGHPLTRRVPDGGIEPWRIGRMTQNFKTTVVENIKFDSASSGGVDVSEMEITE